ncbi:MAG TPA: cell division protein ZapA [Polyangiaceae bacterium]|jgi:cell division protein ZapA (FtsZ GTPase activity inhibitor)|nr:cell division protein ZapA [Polyangiaceae bacterium]
MAKPSVTITIAGHSYRMVSTLEQSTLDRHAKQVEERLARLAPGQQIHPQALLLVALSLCHELEESKTALQELSAKSKKRIAGMLERVDSALDGLDENAEPLDDSAASG